MDMRTDADALIMSAAFSAIAFTTAHGWPDTCVGNTDASTHRSPTIPCTRKLGSTTLSAADRPIRADETCPAAAAASHTVLSMEALRGMEGSSMTQCSVVAVVGPPQRIICK